MESLIVINAVICSLTWLEEDDEMAISHHFKENHIVFYILKPKGQTKDAGVLKQSQGYCEGLQTPMLWSKYSVF